MSGAAGAIERRGIRRNGVEVVEETRAAADLVLTAGLVAGAVGGRLAAGGIDQPIEGVSIDSRTIRPGELFIAIRGERFDGHAFVAAALAAGAAGAVVAGSAEVPADVWPPHAVRLVVDDTTRALQALAQNVRRRSGSQVVAITGSAGKTTTKDVAAAFLGLTRRVYRSTGNLNNHIGLPLSLLQLRHRPEVAVVELGMNHPGEISALVAIAEPDVRVWTNVADVHSAFFASLDAIADAKAELLEGATPATVLVANADDPRIMARIGRFAGRLITFGTDPGADVAVTTIDDLGLDGTAATVRTRTHTAMLRTPLLGRGNLANVLAAMAVALHFDVPFSAVVERASTLEAPPHRGEVFRLAGGVTLVDDSYNSNPRALQLALRVIASEQRSARRVAVLGEMLELGEKSQALHEACGRAAAAAGLSVLLTVGGDRARALGAAAVGAGLPAGAVQHLPTSEEAASAAAAVVRPGDLVLVKGSRGIRTDVVVDRIRVEFD